LEAIERASAEDVFTKLFGNFLVLVIARSPHFSKRSPIFVHSKGSDPPITSGIAEMVFGPDTG
jgi:hypothetical protein